ncbi:MAG TPA: peptide ABC transporter substrate-binding protein [Nitrolancea sp.]
MDSNSRFQELMSAATSGTLSRRSVLKRAVALGLSAPAIAALLAACGSSSSDNTPSSASTSASSGSTAEATSGSGGSGATPSSSSGTPSASSTEPAASGPRGGGGTLRLLWWQAPTIINCHLSSGTKDFDAARLCLEPLVEADKDGKLIPVLAAEVPSLGNGVAQDGTSVTYKLRENVKWHDGQPFTADDVKFTFDWVSNPDTAATTSGNYMSIDKVEVVDPHTVTLHFKAPNPDWFTPFRSGEGVIIPQHIMKDFIGSNAHSAPFNLKPIGTGPFKVDSFTPGDNAEFSIFADYWDPGKPHFDAVSMKGGGDAASASRAVIQSGEVDYAWNIQVEEAVLKQIESTGELGKFITWPGGGTEKLLINRSDPNTEQDGQKSNKDVPHPHFKVLEVRQALNVSVDRDSIAKQLYGRGGTATPYVVNNVTSIQPKDIKYTFDLDQAASLLDKAGAKMNGKVRNLNGRDLHWVYQTSVNAVRQKTQEIVKQSLGKIGVEIEIKSIDASVYFSGDPSNDQTTNKFYADLEMYTNSPSSPFPILWFQRYLSTHIAQKDNQWALDNYARINSPEFDKLYDQVQQEMDPDKSTALFQQIMHLVWDQVFELGLVSRQNVSAVSNKLQGQKTGPWTYDTWDVKDWSLSK